MKPAYPAGADAANQRRPPPDRRREARGAASRAMLSRAREQPGGLHDRPDDRRGREEGVPGGSPRRAGALPGGGDAQRPLPGAGPGGAPPRDAPVGGDERDVLQAGQPHRLLPLGRVPAGAPPGQQPPEPRPAGGDAAGHVRARLRPRRHPGPGGGARPRQRGARAAGRLLHGLARDARDPDARLRDPLRVRDLRPADPRRVAGREDRQVAGPGQPLGDSAPGDRLRRGPRRPHGGLPGRARPLPRALGARARGARRRLRRADPRLPQRHGEPPAPLEGGGHRVLRLRRLQPGGLLARGGPEGGVGEHHQGPLPERRDGEGQEAAARAAALLRVLRAPGHDPHLPAEGEGPLLLPREVRRPAQRHAPRGRRWPS